MLGGLLDQDQVTKSPLLYTWEHKHCSVGSGKKESDMNNLCFRKTENGVE